jgi:hypothetical protein
MGARRFVILCVGDDEFSLFVGTAQWVPCRSILEQTRRAGFLCEKVAEVLNRL